MVINEQQYSVGTQGIHSGGQYSFDLYCKLYYIKEIRWDATAQHKKGVTSIRFASARTVLWCGAGYLVRSVCIPYVTRAAANRVPFGEGL